MKELHTEQDQSQRKSRVTGSNSVGPFAVTPENQNQRLERSERLARRSLEKVKRRSYSLENRGGRPSKQALAAASVHRRPAKKSIPRNSRSHHNEDKMRELGNAPMNASERANETKSSFSRYKDRAVEIAKGGLKQPRTKSRKSSKRTSEHKNNCHMSTSQMTNDKAAAVQMEAGSKSYGHLDHDIN